MMKRTRGIGLVLSLILVFSLTMGSMPVYGKGMFTDVDEKHWGYDYIEKTVSLGLMDGYSDSTFRPNERLNRADALVHVTRLMNIPKAEVEGMRKKYNTFLNRFNLTEGRKDGLAIALSKGLVNEKFLINNLFGEGKLKEATKLEVCVYIVKAMGMEEEAKSCIPIFTFDDSHAIPIEVRPYVKFLIDKDIFNEKGDGQNKFNPNQPITRVVLAKILSLTYDEVNGDSIIPPEDIQVSIDGKAATVDSTNDIVFGTIKKVSLGTPSSIEIKVRDTRSTKTFYLPKETKVSIDGKESHPFSLNEGDLVKVEILDNLALNIVAESK